MYKVLIVPLQLEHSETSWRWRNDPEIWKYTGNRPSLEITPEMERDWLERALIDGNSRRFAIMVDDLYVGNIQLTNISHTEAQYHIFIGEKNYWGGGIAFSASKQLIRFARNVLGLNKLHLFVNPNHEKAMKLYERLGFEIVSNQIKMELILNKSPRPVVSIFCMVYNHQDFLRECLNGFIMQKCNFDFEIVVGEDCSTDSSRKILLEYARNYPGKFKLILHDKNIGALANQQCVLENCNGKYIAICEGDDYWTDSMKLQKQVDFLEENPCFSLHYFNSDKLVEKSKFREFSAFGQKSIKFQFNESFSGRKIGPTLTMMIRRESLFKNLDLLNKLLPNDALIGDWSIELVGLLDGHGYLNSEVVGVYRVHESGRINSLRRSFFSPRLFSEIIVYSSFLRWGSNKLSEKEKSFARKKLRGNYYRVFTTVYTPKFYIKFLRDFRLIFFN